MALEIVALRHQLDVLQRNAKRPRLQPSDRALWAILCRILPVCLPNISSALKANELGSLADICDYAQTPPASALGDPQIPS